MPRSRRSARVSRSSHSSEGRPETPAEPVDLAELRREKKRIRGRLRRARKRLVEVGTAGHDQPFAASQ